MRDCSDGAKLASLTKCDNIMLKEQDFNFFKDETDEVIHLQNYESELVFKSVVPYYIEEYNRNSLDLLLEGIAILPAQISNLSITHNAVFAGYQDDGLAEQMKVFAQNNP